MTNDEKSPWMTPALLETVLSDMGEGIVVLDSDLRVRLWNKTIENLSGIPPEDIIGKLELEVFPFLVEAGVPALYQRVLKGETIRTEPYPFWIHSTGCEGWVRDIYTPLLDSAGQVIGVIAIVHDLTEHLAAIQELKKSEEFLRTVLSDMGEGVMVLNRDLRVRLWNKAIEGLSGITQEEIIGRHPQELLPFLTDAGIPSLYQRALAGETIRTEPTRFQIPSSGKEGWGRRTYTPLRDGTGEVIGVIAIIHNLTEQMAAIQEMRDSQAFLRGIVDSIAEGLTVSDLDQRVLLWNRTDADSTETPPEAMLGKRLDEVFPDLYIDSALSDAHARAAAGEIVEVPEWIFTRPSSGEKRWVRSLYSPHRNADGEIIGVIAAHQPITDKKKAQDELKESEEFLRTVLADMGEGVSVLDGDLKVQFWNKAIEGLSGVPSAEVIGKNNLEMFPFLVDAGVPALYQRALAGETVHTEPFPFQVRSSGKEGWVRETYTPLRDGEGQIIGLISIVHDLTEQMKARDELKKSEEFLRTILSDVGEGIIILGKDLKIRLWNKTMETLSGMPSEAVVGEPILDLFPFLKAAKIPAYWERALAGETVQTDVFRFRVESTGREGWAQEIQTPLRDAEGNITGIIEIVRDLTVQKEAEDALRTSEERFRLVLESSPNAITVTDLEGLIIVSNPMTTRIHGYTGEELLGMPAIDLIDEEDQAVATQNMEKVAAGRTVRNITYRLKRKDGSRFTGELSAAMLRNEKGEPIGFVGITEDVTERRAADAALRTSEERLRALAEHLQDVREEEQRRLARELHDELGQAMTALKIDVDWMRRNRDEAAGVEERLGSMSEIVEDLLARTRALTAQLRPKVLDDLGLVPAVEWLTRDFETRNGISCDLSVESYELQLDGGRATTLYRILQEALTNIARHAEATSVEIRIHQDAGGCRLEIADDGRGMAEADQGKAQSFGLIGIRERLVPFGGDLAIESSTEEGTRLTVRLPVQDEGA